MISNITVRDLSAIVDIVNIIDIRSIEKYNCSHIPNAKNVPVSILMCNPEKHLDFNKVYYIYCQQGIISTKICNKLARQKYKVVNIIGGYESWLLEK